MGTFSLVPGPLLFPLCFFPVIHGIPVPLSIIYIPTTPQIISLSQDPSSECQSCVCVCVCTTAYFQLSFRTNVKDGTFISCLILIMCSSCFLHISKMVFTLFFTFLKKVFNYTSNAWIYSCKIIQSNEADSFLGCQTVFSPPQRLLLSIYQIFIHIVHREIGSFIISCT